MNLDREKSLRYIEDMYSQIHYGSSIPDSIEIVILPSMPFIHELSNIVEKYKMRVSIGAQNCSEYNCGSYTGQVSVKMLSSLKIRYILLNHCEVKKYSVLSDKYVLNATKACFSMNITPIICFSEDELNIIAELNEFKNKDFILVYEPQWAVGKDTIDETEKIYRSINLAREIVGDKVPVLYGGSVKTQLLEGLDLFSMDGLLIGRASLNFHVFFELCKKYLDLKKL